MTPVRDLDDRQLDQTCSEAALIWLVCTTAAFWLYVAAAITHHLSLLGLAAICTAMAYALYRTWRRADDEIERRRVLRNLRRAPRQ